MAVDITEQIAIKRIAVCGNNSLYYEDFDVSAGTLIKLTASDGEIDTAKQLDIFEAFQKVFVVNGTNLKVADFMNTKLVHGALDTPHVKGDVLTQDQTGDDNYAYMVVDYTNADKTATYGHVYYGGTSTSFNTTDAITGNGSGSGFTPTDVADFVNTKLTHTALDTAHANGDTLTQATSEATMTVDHTNAAKTATYGTVTSGVFTTAYQVTGSGSGSAFTPSATRLPVPHWYDWTVYQGDTSTYGTMPSEAYLGCLYRGRLVLSGDSRHPHQWWMSKIADPWNFNTAETDTISAVTHANSDVGEIGDIVTAIISYKDDFCIFGCVNSIWVLVGDPRAAGQLAEMSLTTGIWGAKSWCIDSSSNLYFLGNDGIYKVPISESFSPPENISQLALPNLIADLDLDRGLHRVTMGFDPIRNGVLLCKTLISDGTNKNYWFDLVTKGFFPETYPEECGAYSLFFYPANDDTYKDLLVGCKDGYIRKFVATKKDDNIGDTNETISSYVTLPVKLISEDEDREGILTWLNAIPAGGRSNGDFADSDSVEFSIYIGDDAETVLEDIKDGAATIDWADSTYYAVDALVRYNDIDYICITAHTSNASGPLNKAPDTNTTDWATTAFITGTWSGTGKQNKSRVKARGCYVGIKLTNYTGTETWAVNKVYGNIEQKGRIK